MEQAREYLLKALTIFDEFNDKYKLDFTLDILNRLWQASRDYSIPEAVASTFGVSEEEAEARLESATADSEK